VDIPFAKRYENGVSKPRKFCENRLFFARVLLIDFSFHFSFHLFWPSITIPQGQALRGWGSGIFTVWLTIIVPQGQALR